ncbi:MAG: hypothetical protein KDC26_04935 [Armatimonadetes bacterium]|nr:hypothetical protein [Armatimonadota bacterium]
MSNRQLTEEDVHGILMHALEKKGGTDDLRKRLMSSGRELGLSEEEIATAEAEFMAKENPLPSSQIRENELDLAERYPQVWERFRSHQMSWLAYHAFITFGILFLCFIHERTVGVAHPIPLEVWMAYAIPTPLLHWILIANKNSNFVQSRFISYLQKREQIAAKADFYLKSRSD